MIELAFVAAVPFLTGLSSPDGLFATEKGLYICEETAGTVVLAATDGSLDVLAEGLSSPEGICVTADGRVYVVEDTREGRLVEILADSEATVFSGLCCPEGVTSDSSGTVWFTTGGFEGGCLFTSLWKLEDGVAKKVYSLPSILSFSDVEAIDDGMIYVCSEASGIVGDVSVFRFNPVSGMMTPFAMGVASCEGICSTHGGFPLYVTAEAGAVYMVDPYGNCFPVQSGLSTVEDVAILDGQLYISEDGTGSILVQKIDE